MTAGLPAGDAAVKARATQPKAATGNHALRPATASRRAGKSPLARRARSTLLREKGPLMLRPVSPMPPDRGLRELDRKRAQLRPDRRWPSRARTRWRRARGGGSGAPATPPARSGEQE